MVTKKRTLSVRLDADAERRLEKASRLMKQSRGAFLEKAADEKARQILLEWAKDQHRAGTQSFSELADETGLAIEEIMMAVGDQGRTQALDLFLASCRTIAEKQANPEFLRMAKAAAADVGTP